MGVCWGGGSTGMSTRKALTEDRTSYATASHGGLSLNAGAGKNYFLALLSKQSGFWKARVQPGSGQAEPLHRCARLPWLSGDFRIPCGFLFRAPQGRLAHWERLMKETKDEDI